MKKQTLGSLVMSMTLAVATFISLPVISVHAEVTPTVIYSTIEGGSVEIELEQALYPITAESTRVWKCNDVNVNPDGVSIIDASEGQNAKLKLATTTTAHHMQNYTCTDTTSNTLGKIVPDQVARLYVISQANYQAANLSTRTVEKVVGDTLYAKDLTLYIDSTPYPNFAPLRFLINAEVKDKIEVTEGNHTYYLTDIIAGRSTTVEVVGLTDAEAPKITALRVKDNMADKYAMKKVIEVTAEDKGGIHEEGYYFAESQALASAIKERVLDGDKAKDLIGISWSKATSFEILSNGIYTVFVRDKAGNISYKDITVSKISCVAPNIMSIALGKEEGKTYLDVTATDGNHQPLQYKLNKGDWQKTNRLFGVKDGVNTIYVKNEAGAEVSATKDVFLDVYENNVAGFSPKNLYNCIQVSPLTWTKNGVQVSLVLPDTLSSKLAASPYSVNGGSFSTNRTTTVSKNGDTVYFTVKDIYGQTHTSEKNTVTNIDQDDPSIEVTVKDANITVKAQDALSGIAKITVSSTNATNYVIKANSTPGVLSDTASYTAPSNGSFQFTVHDFAGNQVKATGSVTYFTKENGKIQAELQDAKAVNGNMLRAGNTTGKGSGSSTLGIKQEESSQTGTHVNTIGGQGNRGFLMRSTAGNSKRSNLPKAEVIQVVKQKECLSNEPPIMMEEIEMDSTNNHTLKIMLLMLPVLMVVVLLSVVLINSKKLKA